MTDSIDLSLYTLYAATPEQVLRSRKEGHVQVCLTGSNHTTIPLTNARMQWGRGSLLEDFLKREHILDVHEHAQNGRLVTWLVVASHHWLGLTLPLRRVLVPRNDPLTLDFLCSCET